MSKGKYFIRLQEWYQKAYFYREYLTVSSIIKQMKNSSQAKYNLHIYIEKADIEN